MDEENSPLVKAEPGDDSDQQSDETESCIKDMLQEMQSKERIKRPQAATVPASIAPATAVPEQSTPQEHDENSFYNVHSDKLQSLKMCTGELDIVLEPKLAGPVYNAANLTLDRALLNRADMWHQVIVHHGNGCTRQKILEALFGSYSYCDFFPVAYRRHANADFFLLRMCSQVLLKMFEEGLQLKAGSMTLPISVRLGAARFHTGQIFPRQTITKAVQERCDNAAQYGDIAVLNLDSFAEHASLRELCVYLGNRAQFEVVCSAIAQAMDGNACISRLRLANNDISHMSLLAALKDTKLISLDLRGNRIKHPSSLRLLKDIPLVELYVEGNNLTDVPDYEKIIRSFFPNLLKLDSNLTQTVTTKAVRDDAEEEEEVEITSPGTVITEADLNPGAFQKYNITPHWHKVTVHHNGVCNKQDILDGLFHLLGKHAFYPCYYKTYSKQDEFLVQNCFEALLFLVKQKLKLPIPAYNTVLKLALAMNVAEASDTDVQPLRKLERFVNKRFKLGCLDLCSMQDELNECKVVDFCAKSPSTLAYMLEFAARKYGNSCLVLRLRNNDLRNCAALESLSKFYKLVSLDLRSNALSKISDLQGIPWNNITELFLDNNPLCGTMRSSVEYVRKVRQYFGMLQQLDGRTLLGNFTYCQNFLCTPEAYKFAESFVKHYFALFDSFQRGDLQELYHAKAQFSMTCDFDIERSGQQLDAQLDRQVSYSQHSRNLLQFKDSLDRAVSKLIVGNERIGYVLTSFPKTEFDFCSFRIDVPVFTPERVMITVHGRMHEDEVSALGQVSYIGFTRTWYLQPCGMGTNLFHDAIEYKIHNDMLHMYSMTVEGNDAIGGRNEATPVAENGMDTSMQSDDSDRENAMIVFKELTQLNRAWCKRCLEESSWNLKVALNIFLKLYESKRIPKIAFKDDIP
ncbi:nuclear RNA export factor 2 [Anopheles arabiensis]|uniref:NTF2 domain-containing protein n=1 Tax=Anopheles arabiensis TaxID=7173 RepID=A0A182I064_ANOAR|nr:nuclear RNA export factor 2 [Anopheles arabiensis]